MPEYITQLKANGTSRYIVGRAKNATCYDNMAAMVADASHISAGQYVQTSGYHSANDGGGGLYRVQTAINTDYRQEIVKTGVYATLIPIDGTINVKQCGAKGDGTTDDTAAIQAALNIASASTIIFPPGTYICNWAQIPSNKHLKGDNAVIKVTTANVVMTNKTDWDDSAGTGTGAYGQAHHITIEDLEFCSNMDVGCSLLAFGHSEHIRIVRCSFHSIKQWHFIEINSCHDTVIEGCSFYDYGNGDFAIVSEMVQLDYANSGDHGVFPWFGPWDDTTLDGAKIIGCEFRGSTAMMADTTYIPAGIGNHSGGSTAHLITNVVIANNTFKYLCAAIKFVLVDRCLISNNVVEYCKGGFAFLQTNWHNARCTYVTIEGNTLSGTGNGIDGSTEMRSRGITSFNSETGEFKKYFNVRNNRVMLFYGHQIAIQATINVVENNDVTGSVAGHGIYCGWDEFGSKYSGNVSYANHLKDLFVNVNSEDTYTGSLGDIVITGNKATNAEFRAYKQPSSPVIICNNIFKNVPVFENATDYPNTKAWIKYEYDTILTGYTPKYQKKASTVTSLSANAWTEIVSITGLKPGLYFAVGQFHINGGNQAAASGAWTGTVTIGLGDAKTCRASYTITDNNNVYNAQIAGIVEVQSTNGTIKFHCYSEQAVDIGDGWLMLMSR